MLYKPVKHNRRSIRLLGYDYSSRGAYFVTLCVQNRECVFGKIQDKKMQLNDAGEMITSWYMELPKKFDNVICDEHIVMPDHFHSIIRIVPIPAIGGADLCVCPDEKNERMGEHAGSPRREKIENKSGNNLPAIVQWFKTMTTNEYIRNVKTKGWKPFSGKLWQRNYFEHICRDEYELIRIRQYIKNNPRNWGFDEENMASKSPRYVAMLNPQRPYL
jgi:putative transposase